MQKKRKNIEVCTWLRVVAKCLNLVSANFALIETIQLICYGNQLTGFYMKATLALNGLSKKVVKVAL